MCWVCWGGLRLLRVAWEDFVCGFWAGLVLAWCWLGGALGWLGAGFGVAVACVVIPCLRSYACWAGLGSVGGIATIGAALRRVVGVSGVYGCKTPRVLGRKGQRRVPVEGSMVAKPPAWLLGRARAACSLGGCVGRVRLVFVCLSWWCGLSLLVAWGELLP